MLNDFLANRMQSQISSIETKFTKLNTRVGTVEANVIAEKTYWSGPIASTVGASPDFTALPVDFSPHIPIRVKTSLTNSSAAATEKLKVTIDGITCTNINSNKPETSPVLIPLAAFGLKADIGETTKTGNSFSTFINISCTDKTSFINNFLPFIKNSGDFEITYNGKTYAFTGSLMSANSANQSLSDHYVYDMYLMYHVELSSDGVYKYPADTSAATAQWARLTGFVVYGNQYDVADFKLNFNAVLGANQST